MASLTEPRADLSRSSVSRYIQLSTLFRRRIESGQWRVGQQIPTVEELSEEFGVARATIRQALGILEGEGLVSRYRAKGTFVNEAPQAQLWCEVKTDWSGLLRSREGAEIELLHEEQGSAPPQQHHPIGTLAPAYRHLRRRHGRDGKPFLLADVYIDERLAPKIPRAAFTSMTALKLASSAPGVKIEDARQTLTIGMADIETATLLDLPLNAPVCQVNRTAVDHKGRIVLIANGLYRGDVVRLDMKLK